MVTAINIFLLLQWIPVTLGLADFKATPQVDCVCVSLSLTAHKAKTKSDCVLTCLVNPNCRSFRFNESANRCEYSDSSQGCFHYVPEGSVLYRKTAANQGTPVHCLILRRSSGSISFARNWTDYFGGFGDDANFWLGLNKIHALTGTFGNGKTLRVDLYLGNKHYYSQYAGFRVDGPSSNYRMNYSSFLSSKSNVDGDSLQSSRGAPFSTVDATHGSSSSCSVAYGNSGWWFGSDCSEANPTGKFGSVGFNGSTEYMVWRSVTGEFTALSMVFMRVKY